MREMLHTRGLTLAVCTSKPTRLAHLILERLSLERYFTRVFGADSFPLRKPDPRVLREAMRALGTSAAATVLIGDNEVDAATAAGAGIPFVLMTHGHHRCAVGEIPCATAPDDFKQLADFLAGS